MTKTQESELVEFLSRLNKTHIDELIDILTDFGSGRVALNSTVKDVLLHEKELSLCNSYSKEFIELIITEFQLYAGNTFLNLVESVSYEEALDDVYSLLFDNNKKAYSMQQKENSILNRLLDKKVETSSFEDRLKASRKYYRIFKKSISNQPVTGSFSKFIRSFANSIFPLAKEAYRITLPFILQISWLKMKYGFYESNTSMENIIKYKSLYPTIYNRKIDNKSISILNQTLNIAPNLFIKRELSNKNHAIVNIPLNKLTKAKDEDGLRAIIHGQKGISENARIYEPKTLRNLINSGILLNLASTLTAQKHLADINEKLDEINSNLNDIKEHLQQERGAKITSAYKEASKTYNYLAKGEKISNQEENLLGNHLTHIQQVYDHIQIDLIKISNNIKECNKLQSNNLFDLLKKYNFAYEELKLCCNAILSIYAIFFLSSKEQRNLSKMEDIKLETSGFLTEIVNDVKNSLDRKLKESESIFNFDSTDLANRAFVYNRKFNFDENLSYSLDKIQKFSSSFLEDKSVDIYISLENGQIKEAQFIDT